MLFGARRAGSTLLTMSLIQGDSLLGPHCPFLKNEEDINSVYLGG